MDNESREGTECFPHFEEDIVTGNSKLPRFEHPQMLLGLTPKNLV